jgi:hypothetical protein
MINVFHSMIHLCLHTYVGRHERRPNLNRWYICTYKTEPTSIDCDQWRILTTDLLPNRGEAWLELIGNKNAMSPHQRESWRKKYFKVVFYDLRRVHVPMYMCMYLCMYMCILLDAANVKCFTYLGVSLTKPDPNYFWTKK